MKTPGDYALLHANGMSWKDIINLIRVETLEWAAANRSQVFECMSGEVIILDGDTND